MFSRFFTAVQNDVSYNMTFDERFVFEDSKMDNIIYNEHKVRYEFACQFVDNKVVLDVASGSGYGSSMLALSGASAVTGVDVDEKAIEDAKKKYVQGNLKYKSGSATDIPFANDSTDVVVSFETIEHLKDYKKFLSEVQRVLRETGVLIISTPNREVYQEKNPYHLKEFERNEFETLLKEYFPQCKILDQVNSMTSAIAASDKTTASFKRSNTVTPQYFVAVCSNNKVNIPEKNFVNSNPKALERLKNNPVMKVSDMIYGMIGRLFKK